jgi:hypothetical protein
MWMDGILSSEKRQAAIDFKFDDKDAQGNPMQYCQ